MTQSPKVSIVVPVFNEESVLENCIQSLLELDYPKKQVELIFVDNASTDRSAEVLNRFNSEIKVWLQVLEANRGTAGPPFQHLLEFLNREISKAWLGQTLTTDIAGQQGSFAAASVHEFVRQDILGGDVRGEGRTIRRQLLAPMTRFRFGPEAPVPFFRRQADTAKDATELAGVLDMAVNQLGMRVPEEWTRRMLGIPEAGDGEGVLTGDRSGGRAS